MSNAAPSPTSPSVTAMPSHVAPARVGLSDRRLSSRQREILDELDAIVVEEGFATFTIQQLASRLRCSRRTLYELAPSKDELVLFVIDRRMHRTGRLAAAELHAVDDPAERLTGFILGGTSKMRHTTLRYQEDIAGFPAAQRLIAAHYRYASAIIADIVADGIARGRFRSVRPAFVAELVDATLERFQSPVVLREQGLSFEDAVEELVALLSPALTQPVEQQRPAD